MALYWRSWKGCHFFGPPAEWRRRLRCV